MYVCKYFDLKMKFNKYLYMWNDIIIIKICYYSSSSHSSSPQTPFHMHVPFQPSCYYFTTDASVFVFIVL